MEDSFEKKQKIKLHHLSERNGEGMIMITFLF
jgi:hypothetical protein